MSSKSLSPIVLATLVALATACVKDKAKDSDDVDIPDRPVDVTPVVARSTEQGLLEVRAELKDDGLLLHVGKVPAGATLECDLDDVPLVPCHDGALFARPGEGDHKVLVVAMKNGQRVAVGESQKFTVLPGTGGAFDSDNNPKNPLMLLVDDPSFQNDMTKP